VRTKANRRVSVSCSSRMQYTPGPVIVAAALESLLAPGAPCRYRSRRRHRDLLEYRDELPVSRKSNADSRTASDVVVSMRAIVGWPDVVEMDSRARSALPRLDVTIAPMDTADTFRMLPVVSPRRHGGAVVRVKREVALLLTCVRAISEGGVARRVHHAAAGRARAVSPM